MKRRRDIWIYAGIIITALMTTTLSSTTYSENKDVAKQKQIITEFRNATCRFKYVTKNSYGESSLTFGVYSRDLKRWYGADILVCDLSIKIRNDDKMVTTFNGDKDCYDEWASVALLVPEEDKAKWDKYLAELVNDPEPQRILPPQ